MCQVWKCCLRTVWLERKTQHGSRRTAVVEDTVPAFSLEKDLTVSLCPAVEAREKLEADRARGKVITGDTFTRDAISRHDYHTQTCWTTGDAPSRVQGQPVQLSAERKEDIQREDAELLHEVDEHEVRIQQLED